MGVTTQIDNNKESLTFPPKIKLRSVEVLLLEHDGSLGHDGHAAVTLNRGMLCPLSAVGGSSSLLGGPTFSLNISALSTKIPLNNY